MTKGNCNKAGCTVSETGICLLSHSDLNDCPHYNAVESDEDEAKSISPITNEIEPPPVPDKPARIFPPGLELGMTDVTDIMQARYTYIVGILGSWNAGKTCFLLSLYLRASQGALPPSYIFAGSQTLQGFEARARRIRNWKGGPIPDQIADHTALTDHRQPSFLHFAFRETDTTNRQIDVMLTDLPGEWSKNLVDNAAAAGRFKFLRRADGIIVVVDGPLLNSTSRHSELQRNKHLLERLVHTVGIDTMLPLIILVSKCDEIKLERPVAVDELEKHAISLGFNPDVILCAAFSKTPEIVPNGHGVIEALEKILFHPPVERNEAVSLAKKEKSHRVFHNFCHR